MPSAGHNSILFDFFSIIDKELSVFKYIMDECDLSNIEVDAVKRLNEIEIRKMRTHLQGGLLYNVLKGEYKEKSNDVIERIYSNNEDIILNKYASLTNAKTLINA